MLMNNQWTLAGRFEDRTQIEAFLRQLPTPELKESYTFILNEQGNSAVRTYIAQAFIDKAAERSTPGTEEVTVMLPAALRPLAQAGLAEAGEVYLNQFLAIIASDVLLAEGYGFGSVTEAKVQAGSELERQNRVYSNVVLTAIVPGLRAALG